MTYWTGHRPDPPDVVARRPGLHLLRHPGFLAARAAALPTATNNRAKLAPSEGGPGILDQGQTGSCEGHAHAAGATLRLALGGTPVPLISPIACYQGALLYQRQPGANGRLPALEDTGTEPSLVLQALREWGAPSATAWGNYPADPATICNEPDLEQLEAAQVARLDGAYFVQSSGDQKVTDIMTALAAGFPVSIALPASGSTFQSYSGGILRATDLDGPIDHANYLVDLLSWDGSDLSTAVFLVANSWGGGWGELGLWRGDRSVIDLIQDCAVLNLTRLP